MLGLIPRHANLKGQRAHLAPRTVVQPAHNIVPLHAVLIASTTSAVGPSYPDTLSSAAVLVVASRCLPPPEMHFITVDPDASRLSPLGTHKIDSEEARGECLKSWLLALVAATVAVDSLRVR